MTTNHPLSDEEINAFGAELDALRNRVRADLGEKDARYIRRVRSSVRLSEAAGRGLLFAGFFPPTWVGGTLLLSFSKIVENMELGHNVMHGQYDWMNDPEFHGNTYEWNNACPSDAWRHTHNYLHHTYTNVLGRDRDLGYGVVRLFPEQRWTSFYLGQPLWATIQALTFQHAIAVYDLQVPRVLKGKVPMSELLPKLKQVAGKVGQTSLRDYVVFPALAGPNFLGVLAGNGVANVVRNLWTFGIIFCGHFTGDAEVYPPSVLENESRGHWYLRQLGGSGNLSGGPWFHFMSGNLSHQIEHHLFPDIPAHRYAEMAVEVKAICEKYGVHYNVGPFHRQFGSVLKRIVRHALPNRPEDAQPAADVAAPPAAAAARATAPRQASPAQKLDDTLRRLQQWLDSTQLADASAAA